MNRTTRAAAALACLATPVCLTTPVLAGGPTVVEDTPVLAPMPDARPEHDWTGFYAGLSLGQASADQTEENPTDAYDIDDGSSRSLFVGYRMQQGSLVYGGEVELANMSGMQYATVPREISKALDLKSTLGYAKGNLLTYGVVGWSQVEVVRPVDSANFGGISYGAGVEYSVTDRFGVGLEYLTRKVDGISQNGGPQTSNIDVNSLSLRVGLSF